MTKAPSYSLCERWLQELLQDVPFEGWTDEAAKAAAERAGLSDGEQALAAPGGVVDLLKHFFDAAEARAKEKLKMQDLSALRVAERVRVGVLTWLDALTPHEEAVRRATARGYMPWGAGAAMQRGWSVADMIWEMSGADSDDYNRYSKRGLLMATLPGIITYWSDQPDRDDLVEFVDSRLKSASGVGQTVGRVVKPFLDRFGGPAVGTKDAPDTDPAPPRPDRKPSPFGR